MSESEQLHAQISHLNGQLQAVANDRSRSSLRLSDGQVFRGLTGENPQAWLNWLGTYFTFNHVIGNQRTQYAILLLKDAAATWAFSTPQLQNPHNVDFDVFKQLFTNRFNPISSAFHARMELSKLRQNGPVQAYINTFQDLMGHITDMCDADRLYSFLRGLTPELHADCLRANVGTLVEATNLVIRLEAANALVRTVNSSFRTSPVSQHPSLTRQTLPSSSSSVLSSSLSPPSSSSLDQPMDIDHSIRQIQGTFTAEQVAELLLARNNNNSREMRERQQKVRCYNCGRLGHLQKNCWSNKKPKNGEGQRRQ
jgi:hypothetical protein